jgi:hypothetical protein
LTRVAFNSVSLMLANLAKAAIAKTNTRHCGARSAASRPSCYIDGKLPNDRFASDGGRTSGHSRGTAKGRFHPFGRPIQGLNFNSVSEVKTSGIRMRHVGCEGRHGAEKKKARFRRAVMDLEVNQPLGTNGGP